MQNLDLLDKLAGAFSVLHSFNLISINTVQEIYNKINSYDTVQINTLYALIELSERLSLTYKAYGVYSSYPVNIILEIDENASHSVLNIKDYLLRSRIKPYLQIDTSTFDNYYKNVKYLSGSIKDYFVRTKEIISNITIHNYKKVLNELNGIASMIRLDVTNKIIQRKLLSGINQIKLQLENVKEDNIDKFQEYLQDEIIPVIPYFLEKLEVS